MSKQVYIIEHLEPDLYEWCIIEYKHISKIVGKKNLWFTNIKKKDVAKLSKYGSVFEQSVQKMNIKDVCILDPESSKELTPIVADQFEYFVFGGILGDHPPRKRTEEELSQFMPTLPKFNIGKDQMSTDNAVYVVHQIASGKQLSKLSFQNEVEIKINKIESTILPYKYTLVKGKPLISLALIKFLKSR